MNTNTFDMIKNLDTSSISSNHIEECAEQGDLNSIINYYLLNVKFDENVMRLACKSGKLELVKFLIDINCPIDDDSIGHAVLYGHYEIVKYLVNSNVPLTTLAMYNACVTGNLLMINFLLRLDAPFHYICVCAAACNNHVDVLELFYNKGIRLQIDILEYAELGGFLDIVKFMCMKYNIDTEKVLNIVEKHYDKINLNDTFWFLYLTNNSTTNYKNITKVKKAKLYC
jgi:hypothetical protein